MRERRGSVSGGSGGWKNEGKDDQKAGLMPNYPSDFSACACIVRNAFGLAAGAVRDLGLGKRECTVCGAQWKGDYKRHYMLQAPDQRAQWTNQGKCK